jgi:hypothetical protein
MSFLLTPFAAFPLWTDNSRKLAEWGRTLYRLQLQRLHPRVLGDQMPGVLCRASAVPNVIHASRGKRNRLNDFGHLATCNLHHHVAVTALNRYVFPLCQ